MIYNATLLRVDPPGEEGSGSDLVVRIALTPLTAEQGRTSRELAWGAVLVAYIPQGRVPVPAPSSDGRMLVRADGNESQVLYRVVHVIERLGRTLSHVQLFLAHID